MEQKKYTHWIFYLKPEYVDEYQCSATSINNPMLFAYTSKKKYAAGFIKIHNPDAFYIKKVELEKDDVNDLARYFQNNIIRSYDITTKDSNNRIIDLDGVCMTEREYMLSENRCYSEIETLWRCVWKSSNMFKRKYKEALKILYYDYNFELLKKGETFVTPHMDADIFGSFVMIFYLILRDDIYESL